MTTQQIKQSATRLFSDKKYSEAFDFLLQLGAEEFIKSFPRSWKVASTPFEKHLASKEVSGYFWNEYALKDQVFDLLFSSDSSLQLLHIFFNNKIQNRQLLNKLATHFPDTLTKSVKLNAAFINGDYAEDLLSLDFKNDQGKKHQSIWSALRNHELELWNNVQEIWGYAKEYSVEKILIEVTMWCEFTQWSKGREDIEHLQNISEVYSVISSILMADKPSIADLNEKLIEECYNEILATRFIDDKILNLAKAIYMWVEFKKYFLDRYCYDEAYEIATEDNHLVIKTTPLHYYQWTVNGYRSGINQLSYFLDGSELVEELIKDGSIHIPVGKADGDENINHKIACDKYAAFSFLNDLCINEFQVNGVKIASLKVAAHLSAYSTNKFVRNEMMKYQIGGSDVFEVWLQIQSIEKSTGILRRPYIHESTLAFRELLAYAIKGTTLSEAKAIQELITHFPKANRKAFNRFDFHYNVFLKPFLQFGDTLFTPAIFLGNISWFYSLAQEALLSNNDKKNRDETNQQEKHLAQCFGEHFATVAVIDDLKKGQLQKMGAGDADVVVLDGDTLLLIQLKRTYFRTTTKDAHFEQKMIDEKAQKQLNDIEQVLLSNPVRFFEIFGITPPDLSGLKVRKWYVSNSFENIGVVKDGCIKVNYLDVLRGLRYREKWHQLNALIAFVEKDLFYRKLAFETPNEAKEFFFIKLPIPIFSEREYTLPMMPINETSDLAIWNEATNHYFSGESKQAIIKYQEYIQTNPQSSEAWGCLANAYADLKQYGKAEECYQHALKFLPDDPLIQKNYASISIEQGNYLKALKQLLDIYEQYPLLDEIYQHIIQIVNYYDLSPQKDSIEFQKLKSRWESLN